MSITKEKKTELISSFKINEKDTGSADVQVAIITERITNLTEHLKANKKDHHSRHGLLHLVGQRKKFLDYLKKEDLKRYQDLISKLGLRK